MHRMSRLSLLVALAGVLALAGVASALPLPLPDLVDPGVLLGDPVPLRYEIDAAWEAAMMQPIPEMESGIGPGSALSIDGAGCTANFVWTDDFGRLYLGTAGHCVMPDDKKATHGPNADFDPSGVEVSVRTETCPANLVCDGFEDLGPVVYGLNEGEGRDFALVRIPAELQDQVRYEMPMWAGPTGEGQLGAGQPALHYGHGLALGEAFASRGRAGIGMGGGNSMSFLGAAIFGDSGSAVVSGSDTLDGENAVGIITHIGAGTGTVYGTTVEAAKRFVGEQMGLRVWTLPGGVPLPDLPVPEPDHEDINLPTGAVHIQLAHNESTTRSLTYHWTNDWSDVRVLAAFQTTNGSARLEIRDAANSTLLDETSPGDLGVDRTLTGTSQGAWTLHVTFVDHEGTLALRIEAAPPAAGDGNGNGNGNGNGENGNGSGNGNGTDEGEAVPDLGPETPRTAAAPALATLVAALALTLAWVVRRRR